MAHSSSMTGIANQGYQDVKHEYNGILEVIQGQISERNRVISLLCNQNSENQAGIEAQSLKK